MRCPDGWRWWVGLGALLVACQAPPQGFFALGPLRTLNRPQAASSAFPDGDFSPISDGQSGLPVSGASVSGGGALAQPSGPEVKLQARYRLAQVWDLPASSVAGAPSFRPEDGRFLIADPLGQRIWGIKADTGASISLAGDDEAASGLVDVQQVASMARLAWPQGAAYQSLTGLSYLSERDHDRIRILTPAGNLLPFAGQGDRPPALGEAVASLSFDAPGQVALNLEGGGVAWVEGTGELWGWGPNRRVVGLQTLRSAPQSLAADPQSSGAWVGVGRRVLAVKWPSGPLQEIWEAPGEVLGLAHDEDRSLYVLARLGVVGDAAGIWLLELAAHGGALLRPPVQVVGKAWSTGDAPASGAIASLGQDNLEVPLRPPTGGGLGIDLRAQTHPSELAGDLWVYNQKGREPSLSLELLKLKVLQ